MLTSFKLHLHILILKEAALKVKSIQVAHTHNSPLPQYKRENNNNSKYINSTQGEPEPVSIELYYYARRWCNKVVADNRVQSIR